MAQAFTKFQAFTQALGQEKHNFTTGAADVLKIWLTNTAPSASGDAVLADLGATQIAVQANYTSGGNTVGTLTWATSGGTATLSTGTDPFVLSASGGSIGPFQYAVLYNDTAPSDELIGYWDLGSAITIVDGATLELDFSATGTILTIV